MAAEGSAPARDTRARGPIGGELARGAVAKSGERITFGNTMRIALGSDEKNALTDALIVELRARGHEVALFGAIAPDDAQVDWPLTSGRAAEAVARGDADEAIVCCWTGTGASIAANKIRGVRAALCLDAPTAKGARIYNHANVLALSLRATAIPIAKEILDAWFSTPWSDDSWNRQQIERIADLESSHLPATR
jgi:ribose 5-phosphate isomerase B